MRVGIPAEVKNNEYRVAITPAGVHELVQYGHEVLVQAGAGVGSSLPDDQYQAAGATMVTSADDAWDAELVCKVKEPVKEEYHRMQAGQILFTYLHLAASAECTQALLDSDVTAIAYETVQTDEGRLPLLAPMSEVAGRMAPQVGAHFLERPQGGKGALLGGVPGVKPGRVVIIGAGVSGMNAAAVAVGMRAEVSVLDRNVPRLRQVSETYGSRIRTIASNSYEVEAAVAEADLVIGAVLVPGAKAPVIVTDDLVATMTPGSVLVDISIDQGGCFESSRPTTHDEPTFRVHNSTFYCVANMPGAVPHTSTHALANVTLPYTVSLANHGWKEAVIRDDVLARGVNTHAGQVTYEPVAQAHDLSYAALDTLIDR